MSRRKPPKKYTAKAPSKDRKIAAPAGLDEIGIRRRPRKQDWAAAAVAVAIVLAMVASAVTPFFMT